MIKISAQQSCNDVHNHQLYFEQAKSQLAEEIKELHECAVVTKENCPRTNPTFMSADIRYAIQITVDAEFESEEEKAELTQDLLKVIRLYGWTPF